MSIDREIDMEDVVHKYNGILPSHKKKKRNNAICSIWMDLEITTLSEESQISYDITYMWNPNIAEINLPTK